VAAYEIVIHPAALAALAELPKRDQRQIDRRILSLAEDPTPQSSKPLKGKVRGFRSLRAGDYRIIYRIRDDFLLVLVIKTGNRKDVYKALAQILNRARASSGRDRTE